MRIKILGILVVLGILAVGIGGALLVPYMSNTAENTIAVESPLVMDEIVTNDMVGGETQEVTVTVTNNANQNICGYFEIVVTDNTGPFNCDGIIINGDMKHSDGTASCGSVSATCNNGIYKFPCVCFRDEETEIFDATITTASNLAPGNYSFETTVMICEEYEPETCINDNDGSGCWCHDEGTA